MNNCIVAYIQAQDGWVNDFKGKMLQKGVSPFEDDPQNLKWTVR